MIKPETLYHVSNELDIFTLLDLSNEMKRRGYTLSYTELLYLWGKDDDIGDLTKTLVDVELENGFKGSTYVYHYCSAKEAHELYDNRMFKVLPFVSEGELEKTYRNTSENGTIEIPKSFLNKLKWMPNDVCLAYESSNEEGEPCLEVTKISWDAHLPNSHTETIEIKINSKGRMVIPKKAFVLAGLPWEDYNCAIELTEHSILISDGIHD
jgi:hypothetical protein